MADSGGLGVRNKKQTPTVPANPTKTDIAMSIVDAKDYIKAKKYAEAEKVLKGINTPEANELRKQIKAAKEKSAAAGAGNKPVAGKAKGTKAQSGQKASNVDALTRAQLFTAVNIRKPLNLMELEKFSVSKNEENPMFRESGDGFIKPKLALFNSELYQKSANKESLNAQFIGQNALTKIISDLLSQLYVKGQGSTSGLLLDNYLWDFQKRCQNNGIEAKVFETGKYGPILDDMKLGRQTARAMVFVYEFGQLCVAFGLYEDDKTTMKTAFDKYLEAFGFKEPFQASVLKFKRFVNSNDKIKQELVNGGYIKKDEGIDDAGNGTIKGNTGEFIIGLYHLYLDGKIGRPNLIDIKDDKIVIKNSITPADTEEFPGLDAVKEAKKILYCLRGKGDIRILEKDDFKGSWSAGDELTQSLTSVGITKEAIDKDSAKTLLELAEKRIKDVGEILELKDPEKKLSVLIGRKAAEQMEGWKREYQNILVAKDPNDPSKEMSTVDKLMAIDKLIVTPYENALFDFINKLEIRVGELTGAVDKAIAKEVSDPNRNTQADLDEFREVLKKLNSIDGTPSETFSLSGRFPNINESGSEMNKFMNEYIEVNSHIDEKVPAGLKDKAKSIAREWNGKFFEQVERLKFSIIQKITEIEETLSSMQQISFFLGDFDMVMPGEATNVVDSQIRLYYFDFKKRQKVNADYDNPNLSKVDYEKYVAINEFYNALKYMVARKDKNAYFKALYTEASRRYYEILKVRMPHADEIRIANHAKIFNRLEFDDCLKHEISSRSLSYAGLAVAEAYMDIEKMKSGSEYMSDVYGRQTLVGIPKKVVKQLSDKAGLAAKAELIIQTKTVTKAKTVKEVVVPKKEAAATPTPAPTPAAAPTPGKTPVSTKEATKEPTKAPTKEPTKEPTKAPTAEPKKDDKNTGSTPAAASPTSKPGDALGNF